MVGRIRKREGVFRFFRRREAFVGPGGEKRGIAETKGVFEDLVGCLELVPKDRADLWGLL